MKRNALTYLLLPFLLALLVTACKDDTLPASPAEEEEAGSGVYVSVVVNTGGSNASRVPTPEGNGDGSQPGTGDENMVHDLTVFFLDDDLNNATTINASAYFSEKEITPEASGNITRYTVQKEIEGLYVGNTYHVLVIANAGDLTNEITDIEGLKNKTFNEVIVTHDTEQWFLMASEKDSGEIEIRANNSEYNSTWVSVDVERMTARVDCAWGNEYEISGNNMPSEGGNPSQNEKDKVKILGAALVNRYAGDTYAFKRVTNNVITLSDVTYLGDEAADASNYVLDPLTVPGKHNSHYTYTVNITGIHSLYVEVKKEEGAKEERPGAEGDLIISSSDIRRLDAHYGRIYFTLKRKDIKKGLTWAVKTPFQSGMKAFDADNFAKTADGELKQESEYTNSEKERLMTYLPIDENAPEGAVRLNDYKWVQFVINSEVSPKVDLGFFAKYPGFNAYEGGQGENIPAPPFGGEGYRNGNEYYNEDAVLYDVNQLINHLYLEANNENSEIFVNPQTGNMDEEVNSDNAIVAVTAFIDEYVYKYDPTTVYHENPDPATHENLLLWKRVVNGDDRMLHLCTSSNIYSLDGNTSLSENVLSITQRPIYTFYNQNDLDIGTAWGTESVNETGRLQVATGNLENNNLPGTFTNSHKNGRQNTLNIIPNIGDVDENGIKGWSSSGLKWSDVLQRDAEAFGTLNSRYDNIWYACLGRNRDLDGDNRVDANEIRWYLAAIDQLTDIWIGESSLEESARLYTNEVCSPYDLGSIRRHVASSTRYDGTDGSVQSMPRNPWVIWAEEGASVGSWDDSHSYNGNPEETKGRDYYEYRCVRNLGLSLDDINYDNSSEEMEVENYIETLDEKTVTVFDKKYRERYIYLPKLEFNSVRSASISDEDIMPAHHERDEYNLPYRKFAVIVSEPKTSNDDGIYPPKENGKHTQAQSHGWSYYQDQANERNVCPKGYRIPNQRETMLLYTTYPDLYQLSVDADNYTYYDSSNSAYHFYFMIKTAFSFDGIGLYPNTRDGFSYDAAWQTLNLLTTWNDGNYPPGKVRCVRDVTE